MGFVKKCSTCMHRARVPYEPDWCKYCGEECALVDWRDCWYYGGSGK